MFQHYPVVSDKRGYSSTWRSRSSISGVGARVRGWKIEMEKQRISPLLLGLEPSPQVPRAMLLRAESSSLLPNRCAAIGRAPGVPPALWSRWASAGDHSPGPRLDSALPPDTNSETHTGCPCVLGPVSYTHLRAH